MSITRRDILAATTGLGISGLATGALLLSRRQGASVKPTPDAVIDQALHDPDNPVLGNQQGALTVAEYFDYQCPYCKMGHAMLSRVVRDEGDIRLVMKDWPILGAPSVLASQLVLGAVSMGRYHQAHDALMATDARLSQDQIHEVLNAAGIDPGTALTAYRAERDRWDGLLSRNSAQAAGLGLGGTPVFVIGGTVYPGAMDENRLRRAIAEARGQI